MGNVNHNSRFEYDFRDDGAPSSTGFARIDDIDEKVLPEPATISLVTGLLLGSFIILRHRRR